MSKVRVLSVKKMPLDAARFPNVQPPATGFCVDLPLDKAQEALLADAQIRKAVERAAKDAYTVFFQQTVKRLEKFDKLFAGMLKNGAAPEVVAKQAVTLKRALEKETQKWEKSAVRDVMDLLKKLAEKKR